MSSATLVMDELFASLGVEHPRWYLKTRSRWQRAHAVLKRIRQIKQPIGCEVGVFRGDISKILLNENKSLHLSLVDSWEGRGAAYFGPSTDSISSLSQEDQENNYKLTLEQTDFASIRRQVLRMRSEEASKEFHDKYFDFVFIDADHSYEGCKADIVIWTPKIRHDGWLCGHDYGNEDYGVKKAVDE